MWHLYIDLHQKCYTGLEATNIHVKKTVSYQFHLNVYDDKIILVNTTVVIKLVTMEFLTYSLVVQNTKFLRGAKLTFNPHCGYPQLHCGY
jgi:hypothetical protein